MCYEENKSLFSWRREKFFLQKFVTFVMIVDSFVVDKWGTLERAGRYVWKNSFNLVCQYSIRSVIFQVAYK